jgi:carboxynorspermidine decarboxylase
MAAPDTRPPFAGLATYDAQALFAALPTPCYVLDEAQLRRNGEILKGVQQRTGC